MWACTRDVVVGVENLPNDSQFELHLNGVKGKSVGNNVWKFPGIAAPSKETLEFFYGEKKCQLTKPDIEIERGFSEFQWKTDWDCPGLMGYETVILEEEKLVVGKAEVTSKFWQKIFGGDKEDPCGLDCPKASVSWEKALLFANKLSMMEGLEQCYQVSEGETILAEEECDGWRLPTDAEWDLISQMKKGHKYAGTDNPTEVGWIRTNSKMKRHPVCQLKENELGLCDLTGNVWEWCFDASDRNPTLMRVRGGGYSSRAEIALLNNKIDFPRKFGAEHIGFRLVRDL